MLDGEVLAEWQSGDLFAAIAGRFRGLSRVGWRSRMRVRCPWLPPRS